MLEKTLAIPLNRKPLKEYHCTITLFTEKRGLVHTVGYGIGYFGSKRASALDIFNLSEVELQMKRNMWNIHSAYALHTFYNIKNNLSKSILSLSIIPFLLEHLAFELPQENVFSLLTEFLYLLESLKNPPPESLLYNLETLLMAKTLFLLGIFPRLKEKHWGIIERKPLDEALKNIPQDFFISLGRLVTKFGEMPMLSSCSA